MDKEGFEPLIIAFCCQYCSYSAADLAGSMRLQYPPNVRIIRTPCTGRLEVEFFMKAFEKGADGVLVAGCLEGGCHFTEGNYLARGRVKPMPPFTNETATSRTSPLESRCRKKNTPCSRDSAFLSSCITWS